MLSAKFHPVRRSCRATNQPRSLPFVSRPIGLETSLFQQINMVDSAAWRAISRALAAWHALLERVKR